MPSASSKCKLKPRHFFQKNIQYVSVLKFVIGTKFEIFPFNKYLVLVTYF